MSSSIISFCDNPLCYMHEIPAAQGTEVLMDGFLEIHTRYTYTLFNGQKVSFCDTCNNVLRLVNYQGKKS